MIRVQHEPQGLARAITTVVFTVLLVGQFTTDRLGIEYGGPIPLSALAILIAMVIFAYPIYVETRSLPATQRRIRGFRPILFLFILLLLSSFASSTSESGIQDVWNILSIILILSLLKNALVLSRAETLRTMMVLSAIAGIVFSIGGLMASTQVSRVAAFGGGPNAFSRVTGMGMVAVIYLMMVHRRGPWLGFALFPLLIATVLSGSRGGMLGGLVALLILLVAASRRMWLRLGIGALLAAPAIYYFYMEFGARIESTVQNRIIRLTLEEGYTSGRDYLWSSAWTMFQERPLFGWGVGSFTYLFGTYPHNFVFQVAAEVGLVGLVTLITIVFIVALHLRRIRFRDPSVVAPAASASLVFVASMFSGGYYDTRYFWAYVLIVMSAPWVPKANSLVAASSEVATTSAVRSEYRTASQSTPAGGGPRP